MHGGTMHQACREAFTSRTWSVTQPAALKGIFKVQILCSPETTGDPAAEKENKQRKAQVWRLKEWTEGPEPSRSCALGSWDRSEATTLAQGPPPLLCCQWLLLSTPLRPAVSKQAHGVIHSFSTQRAPSGLKL